MKDQKGFTLIELMIVVAIIGILAAIVYPSYQSALADSRRAVAQSDLLELASFVERYYTSNNSSYSGLNTAVLPFDESPQDGATKFYDLSVGISGAVVTLSASPKNAQDLDYCGTLSYDNRGNKGASVVGCWK